MLMVIGCLYSDYVRELDGRKSHTGHIFTISESRVRSKVTLQYLLILSTTKDEYMALYRQPMK